MIAETFTRSPATGRRRVAIRRQGGPWPWVVTIERRNLASLVLPYRTFDEACEDVALRLDLWARLAVRP